MSESTRATVIEDLKYHWSDDLLGWLILGPPLLLVFGGYQLVCKLVTWTERR